MTYHYLECTDCHTTNLAGNDYCWYCGGENLEERTAEWAEPEPSK